ncbi:MAG: hypothetical protein FJZ43_02660 [Candidatus Staskawiczbacteria bacterium]|nr:hypothetical protein [Candidatus Staskawiczbacteria bacterium]
MKKSKGIITLVIFIMIIFVIIFSWKKYYGFTFEKVVVEEPSIFIQCKRTLREVLEAGCYDYLDNDLVNQKFISKEEQCGKHYICKPYYFDQVMEADQVEAKMKLDGYRPATIMALLSFGEKNPDLQRNFPIFALGSKTTVNGFVRSPYLGFFATSEYRTIGLGPILKFHPRVRFLGVKEVTQEVARRQ